MHIAKRIFLWLIPNGIYQNFILNRRKIQLDLENLRHYPRYKTGEIDLPFHSGFKFVDGLTFYSQYIDFFINEIYYFRTINREVPVIIDAGANIGLAIVYWKNLYPGSKIIGFEPDKEVFKVLQENVSNYNNIEIHNVGLYNTDTTLPFMSEGADCGSIVFGNNTNRKPNTEVDVRKLSSYLEKTVDLLKIDIEGAEFEVLKECADLLNNVDRIFVEYHSFIGQEQDLPELLQILKNAGFRLKLQTPETAKKKPFEDKMDHQGMDLLINIFGFKQSILN